MQLEFEFSKREIPCNRPKLVYQGATLLHGMLFREFKCGVCEYHLLYHEDIIATRCINDRCRHIFQLEDIILINNNITNHIYIDHQRKNT